jgi:hypothetical protein
MKMATFQTSPLFTIVVPAIFMAAEDLAQPTQDKLREESRSAHFHEHTRFFVVRQ